MYEVLYSGRTGSWIITTIYGLIDPREPDRIRYVGQTIRPASRYESHLSTRDRDPSIAARAGIREAWVRELKGGGVLPTMILLERVKTREVLTERERHWITTLRAIGQADLNTNKRTEEQKRYLRESLLAARQGREQARKRRR